jgi:hypothetical protein
MYVNLSSPDILFSEDQRLGFSRKLPSLAGEFSTNNTHWSMMRLRSTCIMSHVVLDGSRSIY